MLSEVEEVEDDVEERVGGGIGVDVGSDKGGAEEVIVLESGEVFVGDEGGVGEALLVVVSWLLLVCRSLGICIL